MGRCAFELVEVDSGRHGEDRKITDDLAGRRDLDDVAEQRVGALIGRLDLLEAVPDPDRGRLLAQVGQLAARNLWR